MTKARDIADRKLDGENLEFGDNDKAIFGAGSDLQIYHDGATNDSIITESGTGNLVLQGDSLRLTNTSGVRYLQGNSGAEVNLWHNGSKKLETTSTGIDVTGTVTADGLTVDGTGTAVTIQGNNTSLSNNNTLRFRDTDTSLSVSQSVGRIEFYTDDTSSAGVSAYIDTYGYNGSETDILFGTGTGGNALERCRITNSGNLLVGTTDTSRGANLVVYGNSDGTFNPMTVSQGAAGSTTRTSINFYRVSAGANVGAITTTNTSTSYNTSSDYRLKENVVALDGAADRVAQIPVHRFNFIVDPDTTVDGFLAHEVQAFVPEAVTGEKDATRLEKYEVEPALGEVYTPAQPATYDEEGVELTPATDEVIHSANVERPAELLDGQQWRETTPAVMGEREVPDYQGIDQSKLVPLLTAALQEALQKIDALEARVTALGG